MARVVVVGGGIVGAGVAYHLGVVHGWEDIVVLDQGELPHNPGSTSHAPGGVVVASHAKLMADLASYSSKLYSTLDPIDDQHINYFAAGGLEMARTPERWEDLHRLHSACTAFGIETHLLSADETVAHLDFMDPRPLAGSLYVKESALVRGYHIVGDFLAKSGATVYPHTALGDVEVSNGRVAAVMTTNPEVPRIETEYVVIAANIWSPALTRQFGMEVPLRAFEHPYVIGPSLDQWKHYDRSVLADENHYPLIRDLDTAMYYRRHWDRIGIGSYFHEAHMVRSEDVGPSALRPFTPSDFVAAWAFAQELVPELRGQNVEYEKAYNGMFAFSVDGYPIIGESQTIGGLWSANASWITHAGGVAKSVAEWMVSGTTEWDMRQAHLYRFSRHAVEAGFVDRITSKNYREIYDIIHPRQPLTEPRNVRLTPFHDRQVAAGACFTTFAGYELPNWYESNADLVERYRSQIPERAGWGAQFWSAIQGAEHLATRKNAGLFDLTGLSIIEVSGAGAARYADELCSNRMDGTVGAVTYTCWLTSQGGIKRDLTVARLGEDRFWMFVGEGTLPMDLHWAQINAPHDVVVADISDAYSALGVFGPNARLIMEKVTDEGLTNDTFGYYTGRWMNVAGVEVYGMRISYVGELGWELHIPMAQSLEVWDALVAAGADHGLALVGGGAMDSLRLEKGYRLWGGDIYTEYNVYEAGLGWTAKLDKFSFVGKEATAAAKAAGPKKVLTCLTVDDPGATLMGNEPVFSADQKVGFVTTANFGYSVGKMIAYAYLPTDVAVAGTELEVEYFARRYAAKVAEEPLFDPRMERMKA